jgi:dolichyl-phosphate beta-glucosyltransferase
MFTVMLSLVVPAYNEALRLPRTLDRIREHFQTAGEEYEVIVVDDGSDDATFDEAVRKAEGWPQLSVVRLVANAGKGAAVREGMLRARGDQRAFSDADLSSPLDELTRLRACLNGSCHVAIASRGLPASNIEVRQPGAREFAGKTYNRLLRLLILPGIRDTQCGLKVFTAVAAVACFTPLRTKGFGFDAEVLVRARRHGWSIAEVPVRWSHVEASRVSAGRDASRMLFDLLLLRVRREPSEQEAEAVSSRSADRITSPSEP